MDTTETKVDNNDGTQAETQTPSNPPPLPALPAVDSTSPQLEVGGAALRLDHLGPLVVNEDGTLSRIANWEKMADIERENTVRICKRLSHHLHLFMFIVFIIYELSPSSYACTSDAPPFSSILT